MNYINKIQKMDCLEFLNQIPDNSLDLVITSPPYAEKRKNIYESISEDNYANWLFDISIVIMNKLKPTGSFVVNIKEGCQKGSRQLYVLEYQLKMAKSYNWVETFIWNKTNPFPTGNKKRLKDAFEYCFQFTKTKDFKFFPENCLTKSTSIWCERQKQRKNKDAFEMTNGSNLGMSKRIVGDYVRPSNVITFASSCLNINHPAVFPIDLPTFFINLMTEENDLICDPFMGSGTTALAAKTLNRNFTGSESKEEYINLANSRITELEKGIN